MRTTFDIDELVNDLQPVRRLHIWQPVALTALMTMIAVVSIASIYGLRADIMAGQMHPMALLRAGALLLLGVATMLATIATARPAVGRNNTGWRWALAMAALFPMTALVLAAIETSVSLEALNMTLGMYCVKISFVSALLIGGTLTLWLRQGAPTSLTQAGWLTGLAAGSFGTFAFSLHCPETGIYYIGLWYSLSVALSALIGRLLVPPLIRW